MTPISLSVVIPAYNAQPFLSRAIESALSQTVPPAEILVVDDGSNDDTFKIASAFRAPVKALKKANGGPASARNLGIQHAHSDWIALLDADDAWLPGKLEEQIKLISSDVALIHSNARGRLNSILDETTFPQLWRRNCILNSSVLLRRDVFVRVGGFDEDPALIGVEDYNLWLRIAASGWKIRGSPKELCIYTPAATSLSRQILRFAAAELANARKIAHLLSLSAQELHDKELKIFDEYGLELLHIRDFVHARQYFLQALRYKVSARRLVWWATTLLPRQALDFRRAIIKYQRTDHSGSRPDTK
jgi:glycosyltransferase involved in cell wall biosynthesis